LLSNKKGENMKQIIFEDPQKELIIEWNTEYTSELIEILNNTVWGTKGTLYKMHDLEKEFKTFTEPYYVTLKENSAPVGVCLFNKKRIKINNILYDCFYLCVLSVKSSKSGQGYGTLLISQSTDYFLNMLGNNGIVYAYVEADNEKSLRVFQKSNFDYLDSFIVPVFSRINPKWDQNIDQLDHSESNLMLSLLNEHYREYCWTDFNYSFDPKNYYTLKDNNEIIAGIQVKEFCWTIENLPGISGKIIVKIFHHLPILKELFNPQSYKFLKIGNIYVKSGYEKKLLKLIESVLASKNLTTCLTYINVQTTQAKLISKIFQNGLLSSSYSKANILIKFKNPQLKIYLDHKPLWISISDSI
jgi:RimJ/RimL family protein N-acetyltransferase